jgi:hypothetical protein
VAADSLELNKHYFQPSFYCYKMWHINSKHGGGQLWRTLNAGKPDQRWISQADKLNDPSQRKEVNSKKWATPQNPIPKEIEKTKPEAPAHYRSKHRAKVFERMKALAMTIKDPEVKQAELAAICAAEKMELDKEIMDKVDDDVLRNFKDWMLGHGNPADHVRAGWWDGQVDPNSGDVIGVGPRPNWMGKGPISTHPSVQSYFDRFVDSQVDFKANIAKLKLAASTGDFRSWDINQLWLYYKYVVLGMQADDVIDQEFDHVLGGDEPDVIEYAYEEPTNDPYVANQANTDLRDVSASLINFLELQQQRQQDSDVRTMKLEESLGDLARAIEGMRGWRYMGRQEPPSHLFPDPEPILAPAPVAAPAPVVVAPVVQQQPVAPLMAAAAAATPPASPSAGVITRSASKALAALGSVGSSVVSMLTPSNSAPASPAKMPNELRPQTAAAAAAVAPTSDQLKVGLAGVAASPTPKQAAKQADAVGASLAAVPDDQFLDRLSEEMTVLEKLVGEKNWDKANELLSEFRESIAYLIDNDTEREQKIQKRLGTRLKQVDTELGNARRERYKRQQEAKMAEDAAAAAAAQKRKDEERKARAEQEAKAREESNARLMNFSSTLAAAAQAVAKELAPQPAVSAPVVESAPSHQKPTEASKARHEAVAVEDSPSRRPQRAAAAKAATVITASSPSAKNAPRPSKQK